MTQTSRILTTHAGSLPRPTDLIDLMFAKAEGHEVDQLKFSQTVENAVEQVVARQRKIGIDLVSDGEMSKPSYATYVADRLTGFAGESRSPQLSDILEYPDVAAGYFNDPGVQRLNRNRPSCNGPVKSRGNDPVQADIENFRSALRANAGSDGFLTAASPGLISMFLGNTYYPTEEQFLWAVAAAMKPEYEAIVNAGLTLQLDCPDLAMARHREFADRTIEEFRDYVRLHVETLNGAVADLPPERMRMHLCWGNYPGPHHRDVPLAQVIDLVLEARPAGLLFEAANPRHEHEWKVFKDLDLPPGKVLIPGVVGVMTNYIDHPELIAQRIVRFAETVGSPERVIAGTDCGLGTFVGLALVPPEIAWRKLVSLVEGARIASAMLG
jgi:5-methyltetrahydropteroyltriglutamate--homocysteine methyltransferase